MSPKVKWVGIIVGLLVGNILATGVLIAASSSGASRVIPAYYDQAIHYDDVIAQAAKDRALGWKVEVAIAGDVIARVHDRNGAPLDDAHVHVVGFARGTGAPIDVELARTADGVYRAAAVHGIGWQDLTITVKRAADLFVEKVAIEAR